LVSEHPESARVAAWAAEAVKQVMGTTFNKGQRLGPYEIDAFIAAGGNRLIDR
jgi:hypothetical protein